MKKQAFSLAEIVIALLIISIIIAASAPLISKRQKLNNMFDCFWQEYKDQRGIISYANGGQGSVGIGIEPNNKNYILHLRMNNGANSTKSRNIAFYDTNSNLVGSLGFYGNNIYFGKGTLSGENNVILGQSTTSITGDTLSIGPLTYSAPLITGKFVASGDTASWPYVKVNGQLRVEHTDTANQYGIVVIGGIYSTTEIKSSNLVATNLLSASTLEVGNPINNLTIENLHATNIVNDFIQIGSNTQNTINNITLDSPNIQNARYIGTQDFTSATIIGLNVNANGTISSDKRLKDVVGDSKTGLEQIRKVEIKDYKWKDKRDKDIHTGVMAQDFQKIFPTLVKEDNKGYLCIQPIELIFVVMNAIKELDQEFQTFKKEFVTSVQTLEYKSLVEENNRLKSEIESLKVKNKELESCIKLQNKEFTGRLEKLENILK